MNSKEFNYHLIQSEITSKGSKYDNIFEPEKVIKEDRDLMDNDFLMTIIGKQGYGKSSLISKLLNTEHLLHKKFHAILWTTPSEIPGFNRDENTWTETLSFDWIKERLDAISEKALEKKKTLSTLWVIDDAIAQIFGGKENKNILDLIIRRRHYVKNVNLSIIFTTQYLKLLPKRYRSMMNYILVFQMNSDDYRELEKEYLQKNNHLTLIIQQHWKKNKYNFIYINMFNHFLTLNFEKLFEI